MLLRKISLAFLLSVSCAAQTLNGVPNQSVSGTVGPINQSTAISAWGDSLTQGNVDQLGDNYPSDLQADTTRLVHNYGVGGQTSAQILTRFQNNPNSYNDYSVIWSGRNDITGSIALSTIQANISAMTSALPASNRYVVMSIVPDQTEPTGSTNANNIATMSAWMASTYPSNYLDIRSLLIADYNPANGGDVQNNANGLTPFTLRSVDQTTTLSAAITNTTQCPSITNSITIGVGTTVYIPSGPEYIVVTGLSGNNISTCTRGYGTTAGTYASGTAIQLLDSKHFNQAGWTFIASQLNSWLNAHDTMAGSHSPLFIGDNLQNIFFGHNAMGATTTGAIDNSAFGINSMQVLSTGTNNSAFGFNTMLLSTTAYNDSAFGEAALYSNTTGYSNVALGTAALYGNTTGHTNTAIGTSALLANTTGTSNVAVGNSALAAITTNANATAVGTSALAAATGSSNAGFGEFSCLYTTSGASNTCIGTSSGWTSSSNAAISASNDTFVGAGAGPSSATQNNYLTIIGAGASYNCANCVVLGRTTDLTYVGGLTFDGSAPTMAAGAAAGTSPTCTTITGYNQAGVISCTTGTSTTASATLATITFNGTLGVAPQGCSLTPRNALSAAAVGTIYTTAPSTTAWTIAVGGTALTASSAYSWSYSCL